MAKDDESQQDSGARTRVYKSKDVHRRRADRKALEDKSASSSLSQSGEPSQSGDYIQSGSEDVDAAVMSPNTKAPRGGDVLPALSSGDIRKLRRAAASAADGVVVSENSASNQNRAVDANQVTVIPVDGRAHRQSSVLDDDSAAVSGDVASEAESNSAVNRGQSDTAGAEAATDSVDDVGDDVHPTSDDTNQVGVIDDDGELRDDIDGGGEYDGEQDPAASPRRSKAKLAKRIVGGIMLVVILLAVGVCAYFAWDRWGRYDDRADMQGKWYVAGTTVPLTIDAKTIHLNDDYSYEYDIDDHGKTIHFTFGPMEGQGRYWFSGDRRFLAITDGEGYNGAGTAFEDVMHGFKDLSSGDAITGTHLPEGEGVIVFCREPGMLATMAKEAAERGIERAKKKAEREKKEEERKAAAQEAAEARAAGTEAAAAGAEAAAAGAGAAAAGAEAATVESTDYYYYDDGSAGDTYVEEYVDDSADDAYEEVPDETYVESSEEGYVEGDE